MFEMQGSGVKGWRVKINQSINQRVPTARGWRFGKKPQIEKPLYPVYLSILRHSTLKRRGVENER